VGREILVGDLKQTIILPKMKGIKGREMREFFFKKRY
jgi:hypothetical protein